MNQKEWLNNLRKLLAKVDIKNPKNISVYLEAFTHKSYSNEKRLPYNQQRLEFLGDSALNWTITNYLFSIKPAISEGDMTIIKSRLVSTETLAKAASELELEKLIYLSKGAESVRNSSKILEDTFEAFLGAIAKDQGIKKVVKVIDLTLVKYHKENLIQFKKDNKTLFQELIHSTSKHNANTINYVHEEDADGMKVCKLFFMDALYGVGRGNNYKEAEQNAALNALSKYQK